MADGPRRPWEKSYNGFSWSERCAATPLQNAALRSGLIVRPRGCSICLDDRSERPQGRDYRFLHNEDYRTPLTFYPVCKTCHANLHSRFEHPDRWQRLVSAHGHPCAWFMELSLDSGSQQRPFDLTYPRGIIHYPPR